MELGPLPEPSAWRCYWRESYVVTWGQWHDDMDPMPDEWEDGPPNEVTPPYTADQMRAYAAEQVAPLLAKIAELQATLELQQRSYEREIVLEVAAERERCMGALANSHGRYWLENRSRIIDAVAAAGFRIMSTQERFWLEPVGPSPSSRATPRALRGDR